VYKRQVKNTRVGVRKLDIDAHIANSIEILKAQSPNSEWVDQSMVLSVMDNILERLPKELKVINEQANFLRDTGESVESQTQKTVSMFRCWHIQSSSISLLSIVSFAIDILSLELDKSLATALFSASILGEVCNGFAYHNNMHLRKVTFQALRLILTHEEIYQNTSRVLEHENIALLLIAACLHDLGHTGKSNLENGVHVVAKMELYSYMLCEPYLKACGLDRDQILKIRTMFVATDVSPIGSESSPMNQMKRIYKYHQQQKDKPYKPVLGEGLLMLEDDATLSLMALLLHEADISISAGLDYDVTCYETILFWNEMGRTDPRPSDIMHFLDQVCHRGFLSEAGKRRFDANIARIYALAEDAALNGDDPLSSKEHCNFILGIMDDNSTSEIVN